MVDLVRPALHRLRPRPLRARRRHRRLAVRHVARAGLRHRLLHPQPQARRRHRRGPRHRSEPGHGRGRAAQRPRPRLRGRGPGRRRRAAALRRRHLRHRHRARRAAPHPRPRPLLRRDPARAQARRPLRLRRRADRPRRLRRPAAVALHLVGGDPGSPGCRCCRRGAGRRTSWTSRRARPRSRPSSTSTPSTPTRSRRWRDRPARSEVRVATSELLASWFGWPVRTFECAVPKDKLGMRWANFALKGWQRLSRVDARLEGPRAQGVVLQRRDHRPETLTVVSIVLFDLDGTLSDSAPGILAALRHAFAVNGLPPLDPHTERLLLGPPFYESLPPLIGGDGAAAGRDRRLPRAVRGGRHVRLHRLRRRARGAGGRARGRAAPRRRHEQARALRRPDRRAPGPGRVLRDRRRRRARRVAADQGAGHRQGARAARPPVARRRADDRRPRARRRRRPRARHRLRRRGLGLRPAGRAGARRRRRRSAPRRSSCSACSGWAVRMLQRPDPRLRSARFVTLASLRWVVRNRAYTPWYLVRYWRFLRFKPRQPARDHPRVRVHGPRRRALRPARLRPAGARPLAAPRRRAPRCAATRAR